MSSSAFALILFSALMHALWNLLVKRSVDKTVFIWWMFVYATVLMNALVLLLPEPFPEPTLRVLLLSAAGAVCFVLYHLFTGRAYRDGDLSMTYPLAQTSMLYVPFWGVLMLGEDLTPLGLAGILLIAAGAYSIQLRRFAADEILKPFLSLGNSSVQAALLAGFIYSWGAVADKMGVALFPPFYFTYLLVMFMMLFMTLNLMRSRYRGRTLREWQNSKLLILASGPVMMSSFLSFRFGLQMAPVSYAVPVRQVSLLIGVLIGTLLLGETCGRIRFAASMLILLGAVLVRFG